MGNLDDVPYDVAVERMAEFVAGFSLSERALVEARMGCSLEAGAVEALRRNYDGTTADHLAALRAALGAMSQEG